MGVHRLYMDWYSDRLRILSSLLKGPVLGIKRA
jgi:hypothetical protein